MIELDKRYVLHVPLAKFVDGEVISIDIDDILEDLTCRLDNFYITMAEGHYRSREYDELLITVFASEGSIEEIFRRWFAENSDVLSQEAFAYEINNRMIIEEVK